MVCGVAGVAGVWAFALVVTKSGAEKASPRERPSRLLKKALAATV